MSAAVVELRSDTFTKPTPEMLEAMLRAEVGDDVWGEDPSVRALEELASRRFGQEAGAFFPSGTMANQAALAVHLRPGEEVICADAAHIHLYEGGGIAANAGATTHLVASDRGRFKAEAAEAAIKPDDPHAPRTRLIAVEDTCNRGGGAVWEDQDLDALAALARSRSLGLHLDGARVLNRIVARNDDPAVYGRRFDSISVCLSKGLGAPVGSVLLGTARFIGEARRVLKRLGGGLRQEGYLAAAGIYALDQHVSRLADDHRRARDLAAAL
ncbi:MAG: GntG family PLP-dependent aldolase, partial [Myxococcota bacterium]